MTSPAKEQTPGKGTPRNPRDPSSHVEPHIKESNYIRDLVHIVDKITSDKKVWLKTMLTEELGLNLDIVGNPLKGAFVMFGAFLLGGIIPVIPYFLFGGGYLPLGIAIGASLSSSFVIGALKA